MRATPATKNAPNAPGHPFHRKPSIAGRMKLTIGDPLHVPILPADKLVFLEVGDVVVWLIVT